MQFSHSKTLDHARYWQFNLSRLRGPKTPYENRGTLRNNMLVMHLIFRLWINNSHVNLKKLDEFIQQMIQITLKSIEFKGYDGPYER